MLAAADETAAGLAGRLDGFAAAVLLDRVVEGSVADAVLSDRRSGIAEAIRHLAGLGHRRIGLVAGSPRQRGSRERILAFPAESERLRLDLDAKLVSAGDLTRESGYLSAHAPLSAPQPPSALIAGNNRLFAGVLSAVRDLLLSVPADLSLVACDDTDRTELSEPPVDVVVRDLAEIGRRAAALVLDRVRSGGGPPVELVLPTSFEARSSSAPPRFAHRRGVHSP